MNHELVIENNNNGINQYSSITLQQEQEEEQKEKKDKRDITTFKYSQLGKGDLHEAIFIENGKPVFIKYNDQLNEFQLTEQIEETTRILVPPTYEECPYLRYEFESLAELNNINKFIESNNVDLDYLYYKGYGIVSKYNNQSKHKLRLTTIKIITSHFQDKFPTTEYLYPVGGNGSGKSSVAETFRAIAYKTVVMTDPSAPNLFRLLGIVEPVQCTMVLEEADKIDKITELMAVLKTGYAWHGMVPKINQFTNKQEFFYTYCPKIIVSERSLNQSIAKGVNSRTFPIPCIKGSTKYDIKEVLNPTNKDGTQNKELLDELIFFRKLLLVYRLRHFKDPIPDLDIGVEGRDKELVKHSIQLFYGCKCLNEVRETLQEFLDIKNEKKDSSIESMLLPIVSTLIKYNGSEIITSKTIWDELTKEIPGKLDEKKPNEYHTDDYGTIYRTTIAGYLGDSFGGRVKHTKKGNVWIFDRETIERLMKEDKTKIIVNDIKNNNNNVISSFTSIEDNEQKGEGVNTVKGPDREGSIELQKKSDCNTTKTISTVYQVEDVEITEGENNTKNSDPSSSDAFTAFTYSPSSSSTTTDNNEPILEEEEEEEVKGFQLSRNGPIHYEGGEDDY